MYFGILCSTCKYRNHLVQKYMKPNHVVLIGYHSTANAIFDLGNIGE